MKRKQNLGRTMLGLEMIWRQVKMSDLGVLSHVYTEWNSYLNSINLWLFSIRKTLDEASSSEKTIAVPKDIYSVLLSIATSIDPNQSRPTSTIPLDLKRKLVDRFRDDTKN